MNTSNPLISITKRSKLKDGTPITVTGEVYNEKIFPLGDPMYVMVNIVANEKNYPAFFPEKMDEAELKRTIKDFCKKPDIWVK